MPTSKLTAVRCPSCGAPIKMGETSGTCQYCNTIVERPPRVTERLRAQFTSRDASSIPPVIVTPNAIPTPQTRGCGSTLVVLLLLMLVGGGLYTYRTLNVSKSMSLPDLIPSIPIPTIQLPAINPDVIGQPTVRIADTIAVSPADTPKPELVAYLYTDGDRFSVGVVDGVSGAKRWESAPLSKDARSGSTAMNANTLFVSDQEQLYAFQLSDGKPLWQAKLSADVAQECKGCLAVVGERVLALQKDGSLHAYDTRNGTLAWQAQLDESPRRLPVMGDMLLSIQAKTQGRGSQFRLIKASDGSDAGQITPHCAGDTSMYDADFNTTDPLLFAADGKTFYALFGSINTCVQRWTIGKNTPDWETWLDSSILTYSLDDKRIKLLDDVLLLNSGDSLSTIDVNTGKMHNAFQADRHNITPLFAKDGVLVVDATPTWDSSKHALWGIDLSTGQQRWEHAVQAKEWRGDQIFGEWDARLTPAGVLVVEAAEDEHQLVIEQLDLQTGTSKGRQVTALAQTGGQVFWEAFWSERNAWLNIGQTTYVLDLSNGNVIGKLG